MKRKSGTFFILLLIFIAGMSLGSYVTDKYYKQLYPFGVNVNANLFNLDIEMDLLEYWHQNMVGDRFVENHLNHLIVNELSLFPDIQPDIKKLLGTPLKALAKAISFRNKYDYDYNFDGRPLVKINRYLSTIEKEVASELERSPTVTRDFKNRMLFSNEVPK